MTKDIDVLVPLKMPEYSRIYLSEAYNVFYRPDYETAEEVPDEPFLKNVRAVQTNGSYGLKRPLMDKMPNLEIICAVGAGYEGIDVAAAKARGIVVTHNPGGNAETVADQGWALLLGIVRQVPRGDRGVRERRWLEARRIMPGVAGKRLGIFGLGHVGSAVARRGAGGFGMEVGYHTRRERQDSPYRYFGRLEDLAEWSDILVVAAPGGSETYHIVNRDILARLGADGYLINVARGALVDTDALIEAIESGQIAGAGLDVMEGEPAVPDGFVDLENLVLSPHVGGFSPEAIHNNIHEVRENLDAFFSGRPVLKEVP